MGVLKNDVGRPSNKTIRARFILKLIGLILVVGLAFFVGYKLFGNKESGIWATVYALTIGAIISASTVSFGLTGLLFAFLGFYALAKYFIKYYYGQGGKTSLLVLASSGICYGLAIACDISLAVCLV